MAPGLLPDGRKEKIDFRLTKSESAAEWRLLLDDLYRHRLAGQGLDMICVDSGAGLLAALPDVHPRAAFQRWAQNPQVLNKVRGSPIRRRTPIPGPPPTGETTSTSS